MKKVSTKKRIVAIILLIVLSIASVTLGIEYGKLSYMTSLGSAEKILDEPPARGKVNLLLLGVDEEGVRADTIMVVSVDNVNKSIKLLSIPRDTRVTLNTGKKIKINACLGYESRETMMIGAIRAITGMPIHHYCEIDFAGFIEIIDILDGVDYNVPYDMDYDDDVQNLHIHLKAGPQHLDGQAAHDFVRFRHNNRGSDVYAPGEYQLGDIGRISAQQKFIKELFRQKMQPQYLLKVTELLDVGYKYVKTDFSITTALKLLSIIKSAETTDMDTFTLPGEGQYINNVSYYLYSPAETRELVRTEFGYEDGKIIDAPTEVEQ
ncbi:MAG: LCP family protein [Clostridia bacterium]|nr:LCP family protein [Clostridia bacterium]